MWRFPSAFAAAAALALSGKMASALPTGAGGCDAGDAVGGTHLNRDQLETGTLAENGFEVRLDGELLIPEEPFDFSVGDDHTIQLTATFDGTFFRGFLIRLEGDIFVDTTQALIPPAENGEIQQSELCIDDQDVGGLTHTNRADKTSISGILNLDLEAQDLQMDVTMVVQNVQAISEWYYAGYTLNAVSESVSESVAPTEAPASESPTEAPASESPGSESPTAGEASSEAPTVTPETDAPTITPSPVLETVSPMPTLCELTDNETAEALEERHDREPPERNVFLRPTGAPSQAPPSTFAPSVAPTEAPLVTFVPTSAASPPTLSPALPTLSPALPTSPAPFPPTTIAPSAAPQSDAPTVSSPVTPSPTVSPTTAEPTTNSPTGTPVTLEEFLFETLTDDGSLTEPGTPQNQALLALEASNPELDPNNPNDQLDIIQRYSLNTLFFATNGVSWVDNAGWTTAADVCASAIAPSWFGITCDVDVVEELALETNDLMGSLPSEIRGLSDLGK